MNDWTLDQIEASHTHTAWEKILLALVREQAAKLEALEELAAGWKPPRENADLDDTQVWYSFAKHHAAQAIRNIVRGL